MPTFNSPGVFVVEKDLSDFPVSVNPSVVGIVGFADKGPTNQATLITSQENLVRTFGKPSEALPDQGLEGALEILETTNQIYYVRPVDTATALSASAVVPLGACPSVMISSVALGSTSGAYFEVQVTDHLGTAQYVTAKSFSIASSTGTLTQGVALKAAFGGDLDNSKVGAWYDSNTAASGFIVGGFAGSGATLGLSAWTDSTKATTLPILAPLDVSGGAGALVSSVVASGTSLLSTGGSSLAYYVESLYAGAGYNAGTTQSGSASGNTVEVRTSIGGRNSIIQVNDSGAAVESFKVSLVNSGVFVENVINTGATNLKSNVIKGYLSYEGADFDATPFTSFVDDLTALGYAGNVLGLGNGNATYLGAKPKFVKFVQSTNSLANGNSGAPTTEAARAAAMIGDQVDKTGIYALDDDLLNISIALVPGTSIQSVQNALVTLAEETQNFLAIVSPPFGIGGVQQANDWTNGQAEGRTAALNSSYAAVYWPWVKTFDTFSAQDRWYDPAIFAARQMAYTDEIAEPWFAPAGYIRGRLTKPTQTEVAINQGDRDSLYGGGNVVNPLVNFPSQGITVFGQRTTQRASTALDRVNVRRLLIVIRKALLASTRQFVFEPNDSVTWERIENVVNPLMDDIRRRRGITEFKVVCDETTNTPVRVDRNELWCKVILKPTKAAEVIVFELNVASNSSNINA